MIGARLRKARRSPDPYLKNYVVSLFWCVPQYSELSNGKIYIIPASCSSVRRHGCGLQAIGHDPGDEDKNP